MSRVIVCGSINHDLVAEVAALPQPGETILGTSLRTASGGKGANQAYAAARAAENGVRVAMLGAVGNDTAGAGMRAELESAGVDVSAIRIVPGPSGTALITVDSAGENTIVVIPGANQEWPDSAVAELGELLETGDVLVLQAEIPIPIVAKLADSGATAGARVLLNAAPADAGLLEVLPLVDILVVNETEAAQLIGLAETTDDSLISARGRLRGDLVVTLGGAGAVLVQRDGKVERLPAFRIDPVDTVGAGDAFVGGMAAALAAGQSLTAAVRVGSAAGALTATALGARHPQLDPTLIKQMMDAS